MKILQVHNRYRYLGGEDRVVELERSLLSSVGHDVLTHIVHNAVDSRGAVLALGQATWNRASRAQLSQVAEDFDPDVIHVHNTWFTLSPSVLAAGRTLGAPTVVTFHNYRLACLNSLLLRDGRSCTDCVGGSLLPGVRHGCYRGSRAQSMVAAVALTAHRKMDLWNRQAAKFLVLSEFAESTLVESGLDQQRIEVCDNFCEQPPARLRPAEESAEVVLVGRLSEEKGLPTLLQAWRDATLPGLRLVVIGTGPLEAELRSRYSESDIEFAGAVDHDAVLARLSGARALVMPTLAFEGQPLSIIEALAAGLPVLASDQPPIRAMLSALDQDCLRIAADVADWQRGLHLLSNDGWVRRQSEAARALWSERFSPQVAQRRLERVYTEVREAGT